MIHTYSVVTALTPMVYSFRPLSLWRCYESIGQHLTAAQASKSTETATPYLAEDNEA